MDILVWVCCHPLLLHILYLEVVYQDGQSGAHFVVRCQMCFCFPLIWQVSLFQVLNVGALTPVHSYLELFLSTAVTISFVSIQ